MVDGNFELNEISLEGLANFRRLCGWGEASVRGRIEGLALVGSLRFFGYFFLKKVT